MKNVKRKSISLSLLLILFGLFLISPNYRTEYSIDTLVNNYNDLNETDSIFLDPISANGAPVLSWWNESYQYRVRVDINNTLLHQRDIPINIWMQFGEGKAHNDSIRLIEYDQLGDTWTPIPYQVWNETVGNPDGNHLFDATITFVVNDYAPGSKIYYVYYDPATTFDPTDFSGYTFNSNKVSDNVNIEWDDENGRSYNLSLDSNTGFYQLEDNYGKNYHTENSSSPGLMTFGEDLIGYWSFNDGTPEEETNTIPDGPGVGYIQHGNVYYDTGKYDQSAYFDGAGDYIAINSNEMGYGGGASNDGFTIMAWINPSASSSERIIASWDRSEYWRLSIDGNDRVLWATYSGNIDDMRSTATIQEGVWTHIAVTYDNSTGDKSIYINGVLDRTDVNQHTSHRTLGYSAYGTRYGFIGTGSEAESFDGTNSPTAYWIGALDEVRIYNDDLSEEKIQLAMDQAVKDAVIYPASVEEVENGPVMSIYNITWTSLEYGGTIKTMDITDTVYFYKTMNSWKIERTFYWEYPVGPTNNQFAALNTYYNWDPNDLDLTFEDYYYYDNLMHEGHDNVDFTVENYAILHDNDGTEHSTAVGLFITDKTKGATDVNFSELKWRIDIDDAKNIINFIPGNESDINNQGGDPPPADYTVTIEFWEYIENDVNMIPVDANNFYNNMYQSFITPLIITFSSEESRFFNLEVQVEDHDGFMVPGVNVSLYNATDETLIDDLITDLDGEVEFLMLLADSYKVSLNYDPFETGSPLWLGNNTFDLNENTVDVVNTKINSYTVNLTSLVLRFMANNATDVEKAPLVGAKIKFKENSSGIYTEIGEHTTDINGNVTLRWTNYSAAITQIDFSCYFNDLSTAKDINITDVQVNIQNMSVDFEGRSYYEVGVEMLPYETNFTIHDISASNTYGDDLEFRGIYNFTANSLIYPINQSNVKYKIQYRGNTVFEDSIEYVTDTNGTYDFTITGYSSYLISDRTYTLIVDIEKEGNTPLTAIINFELLSIPTTFVATPSSNTEYWGDNLTTQVFYNDTYNEVAIGAASVSYYVIEDPSINGFLQEGSPGYYNLEINTTSFPSHGDYTIAIIATRQNYVDGNIMDFYITIDEITTTLTPLQTSIDIYWLENVAIDVELKDTLLDIGIDGATVTWSLVGNPGINGNFVSDGQGWYSIDVNTGVFNYAGDYFINIIATSDNYELRSINVPLTVKEIYTQINESVTSIEEIDIYRTQDVPFNFEYTYRVGGVGSTTYNTVENATYATYEWENRDSGQSGTGDLIFNDITGLYVLNFDTEAKLVGTYIITVRLQEINYLTRVGILTLNIVPMEFDPDITTGGNIDPITNILTSTVNQNEMITITISISEIHDGSDATDATVDWVRDGVSLPFTSEGNGVYSIQISADVNAFFQQQLIAGVIEITGADHDDYTIVTQITVEMPEIFEGMPTFYFLLIIGFVVVFVGAIVSYKSIQYARIPMMVKRIRTTKKSIKKKTNFAKIKINRSAEEILEDDSESDYSVLGLSLKGKLAKKELKGKSDSYESMDSFEREVE